MANNNNNQGASGGGGALHLAASSCLRPGSASCHIPLRSTYLCASSVPPLLRHNCWLPAAHRECATVQRCCRHALGFRSTTGFG